jgi:hypothetical protein
MDVDTKKQQCMRQRGSFVAKCIDCMCATVVQG